MVSPPTTRGDQVVDGGLEVVAELVEVAGLDVLALDGFALVSVEEVEGGDEAGAQGAGDVGDAGGVVLAAGGELVGLELHHALDVGAGEDLEGVELRELDGHELGDEGGGVLVHARGLEVEHEEAGLLGLLGLVLVGERGDRGGERDQEGEESLHQ
jgi:hypothetical protein